MTSDFSTPIVLWEAHRAGGGGHEMPESCAMSFEYGWMLGGIPEADVNITADGHLISQHDSTLRRTTDAPDDIADVPIHQLTLAQIHACNVLWDGYTNLKIPTLDALFTQLRHDRRKQLILDYKNVPLERLAQCITRYDVAGQLTFASCDEEKCCEIKALLPALRIKRWIGGTRDAILDQFHRLAERQFLGFEEVQLHCYWEPDRSGDWKYHLQPEDLRNALTECLRQRVLLQAGVWEFAPSDMRQLLDLGIRSFAVDYPNRFCCACASYFADANWQKL